MIKKFFTALVLVFLIVISGCAAHMPTNVPSTSVIVESSSTYKVSQEVEISPANAELINQTLNSLTSEDFRGRLAGTEGNEKAAGYIADGFKNLGLEPYEMSSYFLEYSQEIYDPDEQTHSFMVEFVDGTSKEYSYGRDYIMPVAVNEVNLTMKVTDKIDEKIGEEAVLLDNSGLLANWEVKPKCAIVKAPSALLYSIFGRADTVVIPVNQDVYDEIKGKGAKNVKIDFKSVSSVVQVKNVAGKIPGKDNRSALIITAHFDHMGWAGNNIFLGAVDNASGVSVMLDIAGRLKKQSDKNKFNSDILFCGLNGEEYEMEGSTAFAEDIKSKYDNISVINMDCVGKKDGGKLLVLGEGDFSTELIDGISKYLKEYKFDLGDPNTAPGGSDHIAFNNIGIPAVTLGQSQMRGPFGIHTVNDTLENIDAEYLKTLSDAVCGYILSADKNLKQ